MPYISTEALVGAGLLVILVLGYQYLPTPADGAAKASKKKKKSKAKTTSGREVPAPVPVLEKGGKTSRAKNGGKQQRVASTPQAATQGYAAEDESDDADDSDETPSRPPTFASVAAQEQDTPTPAGPKPQGKPRTLAQKLAPQPRKTKVDDMLAPEDRPATHARVMKINSAQPSGSAPSLPTSQPQPTEKSHKYQNDYASSDDEATSGGGTVEAEDDGWDVVATKKRKPVSIALSSASNFASSAAVSSSSTSHADDNSLTKVQKKNAKKAEAKKEAKAAEEAERLRRLAMHKKDLEREKINEIYSSNKKKSSGPSGGHKGVAQASVDHNGKLIWD